MLPFDPIATAVVNRGPSGPFLPGNVHSYTPCAPCSRLTIAPLYLDHVNHTLDAVPPHWKSAGDPAELLCAWPGTFLAQMSSEPRYLQPGFASPASRAPGRSCGPFHEHESFLELGCTAC